MKKLLILLLLSSSAFSATTELLIPCTFHDAGNKCSGSIYKITDGTNTCYYNDRRASMACVKN